MKLRTVYLVLGLLCIIGGCALMVTAAGELLK